MADRNLERWANGVAKSVKRAHDRIDELQKHLEHHGGLSQMQKKAPYDGSLLKEMWAHETQYSTTIILLGYGGLFALWTSIHDRLPGWLFGTCGVLIFISLLSFVGFEIAKSASTQRAMAESNGLEAGGHVVTVADARHILSKHSAYVMRFHPLSWWVSVVFGMAAGFITFACFIYHMS